MLKSLEKLWITGSYSNLGGPGQARISVLEWVRVLMKLRVTLKLRLPNMLLKDTNWS